MSEDKRITMDEYIEALHIVERYHNQLMDESEFVTVKLSGLAITDFLSDMPNVSTRLHNVLIAYVNTFDNCAVSEVMQGSFMRLRNAGKKLWEEFLRARVDYIQQKERAKKK